MQEIILLTCELLSALIPFLLAFIAYVHTQKTRGAGLKTGTTILVVMLALYATAVFHVTGAGTLYDALRYRLSLCGIRPSEHRLWQDLREYRLYRTPAPRF